MPAPYTTVDYTDLDNARSYGFQSKDTDDNILSRMITRASRAIDTYIGVSPYYFSPGDEDQTATIRYFWGDDSSNLMVDPYLSAPTPTLTTPSNYDIDHWIEANPYKNGKLGANKAKFQLVRTYGDDQWMIGDTLVGVPQIGWGLTPDLITDGNNLPFLGWPRGMRVAVTAKWGWDATPEDIIHACTELAVAMWRSRDQAFLKVVSLETNGVVTEGMPQRVRVILDAYKEMLSLPEQQGRLVRA